VCDSYTIYFAKCIGAALIDFYSWFIWEWNFTCPISVAG